MSSPSKRKGYSFEVECIAIAESLGFTTKRAWGSNGRAMGEHEEVDIVIGGEKFQCKRRKKIAQDLFPNEDVVEGQIIRADRQKHPYIVLPLPTFLEKYKRAYDRITAEEKPGNSKAEI
jgi:hypothetical protein